MITVHRHSNQKVEYGILYRIWNWFYNPNYNPQFDLQRYGDPKAQHIHKWEYSHTCRNNWRIEDGQPVGKHYDINAVIAAVKENPSHTETNAALLENWQKSGYNIVYVSILTYKCNICGETKQVQAYTAPAKSNGERIPYIIDFTHHRGKKVTQKIPVVIPPTNNVPIRKEIAVEKMKRYS